jgi:hypothetical protein
LGVCIVGLGGPVGAHSHHKHANSIMITQREYVEGCLQWYEEADLQPGNPEDGEWHECHYPTPKCLGGTETVLLLKEHHAVQGVLQSEEFGHPCIYGWEKQYLSDGVLHLWKKWMKIKAQPSIDVWAAIPPEEKRERGRIAQSKMTKEQLRRGREGMWANMTPEQRSAQARHMLDIPPEKREEAVAKATQTNLKRNPNHFADMARKARAAEPYEKKRKRMEACHKPEVHAKALAKINGRKFKCRVTGKISTAGPLTRYQNARGIDPSLRDQVQGDP